MEGGAASAPTSREEFARNTLAYLKNQNLSEVNRSALYNFAKTLLRLNDEGLDFELLKEFDRLAFTENEVIRNLGREEGLEREELKKARTVALKTLIMGCQ
ncbi:MAG: hypothetical protein LBR11_01735 [Deltaproteobacteria bacterium]|jgi:hypothetical protein|nr:hypothetical protein [Deltaproteobacteria bacterium]